MHKKNQVTDAASAMMKNRTKVVAVSSGKGGVGKTNVAANLAVALAADGQDVMLLDADLGLANVDILLGLQPRFNLSHVINGEVDIDTTVVKGPCGVRVVPATSGDTSMVDMSVQSQAAIIQSFADIALQPEILIVDTAAGISRDVARFAKAAQHTIVVVCDEPSSITDSYALIKVLSREYGMSHFHVLTNRTRDAADGRQLFLKLNRVANQFLDVVLRHVGNIPEDGYLKRAVQEQRAVVDAYPNSWSAKAFRQLASATTMLPGKDAATGSIEFFLESVLSPGSENSGDTT